MKKPAPRGRPIDLTRISRWARDFAGYRYPVTDHRIELWLRQFSRGDHDLAARMLDCVDFVTVQQMAAAFKAALASLPGWNINPQRRRGKWRFASFSSSAGESGDPMLWQFRIANGLGNNRYNELFIYKRDLLSAGLGVNDTVVFVDDFAGTGEQACWAWSNSIQELLPEEPNVYLVLVAASTAARDKIRAETKLTVTPYITLASKDDVFSPQCAHFTGQEKSTLLSYCLKANRRSPRGHGDCGFVIVFAHRCPNNSIPILHMRHGRWEGLFPRHD